MRRTPAALFAAVAAWTLTACASTRITDSWKAPGVTSLDFKKVVVIAISRDDMVRRTAEDEMVRQIQARGRAQAVASHTFLGDPEAKDVEQAKAKIGQMGFDGAVTMRLVSSAQETTYVPGSYPTPYYGFYGYYGYAWPTVYDPGYLRTDTIVQVETNVYAVADEKLLWSGVSETFNPSNAREVVDDLAKALAAELRKQGLIT
jgi:hypothetical protein